MPHANRKAMLLLLSIGLFGCGDDEQRPARETRSMQTPAGPTPSDAGLPDAEIAHRASGTDPAYHLDVPTSVGWRPTREQSAPARVLRLTLRSTPPGATALVDGVPIGATPTYWEGPASGKPRNFVFTLRGHSMARYRFVPTTDGVVHATLKKLAAEPADAGPAHDEPAENEPPAGDPR